MKRMPFLLLSLAVVGCVKNPAYYGRISFDQTYTIVGQGQIPRPLTNRPYYTIWYDSQHRPTRITYSLTNVLMPDPAFGVEEIVFIYTPTNETRMFRDGDQRLKISPQQGYAIAVLDYNDKGQAVRVRYYDTSGNPATDMAKRFSYTWVRDSHNRILKLTGYDTNGHPLPFMGVTSVEWTYDRDGNLIEERLYDAQGNLTRNSLYGYAIQKNTYDKHHRLIEKSFYNEKNEPINYNLWYVHKYRYLYNRQGKLTNIERYQISNGTLILLPR